MKTFKQSFILLFVLGVLSCKKSDNNLTSSTAVNIDQAVDMAAGSLASNSAGFTIVTDDIAVNAQSVTNVNSVNTIGTTSAHQECGTTATDSVTRAGTSYSVTYDYAFKYLHTLNCNANSIPDNIVDVLTFHGNFDGPRLSTTGSGSANATIAGLVPTAANYVINGEYKRTGSFQSKIGNKASGNSDIDIKVTNLALSKPSRKIKSGNAAISITGTWPKGSFSYTGTVVFNGDGTATITINSNVYLINLATGAATKS